jgi:hypothetical protein
MPIATAIERPVIEAIRPITTRSGSFSCTISIPFAASRLLFTVSQARAAALLATAIVGATAALGR